MEKQFTISITLSEEEIAEINRRSAAGHTGDEDVKDYLYNVLVNFLESIT